MIDLKSTTEKIYYKFKKVIDGTVYCSKCKIYKPFNSFCLSNKSSTGFRRWCKDCEKEGRSGRAENQKEFMKKYRYSPEGVWSSMIRHNKTKPSKVREVEIDRKSFLNWYDKQKKECTYCGIKQSEYKPPLGIDRKNPFKKYTIDNIVLCCVSCNTSKSNIFTYEEFKEIAKKYISKKHRGEDGRVCESNNSF